MDPMMLASLGLGGIGAIGGIIQKFGANKRLSQLMSQDPAYQISPYARQQYQQAQALLNARMPGATAMERNIYGNTANMMGQVDRTATDAAQALQAKMMAQAQGNQSFQNLSVQEQQDYYNRLQNMNAAGGVMTGELDKQYQDQIRRYQDRAALTGAQMQNTATQWNSLANLGFGGAGIASMLGQGGNNNNNTGGGPGYVVPTGSAGSFMGMTPQAVTAQGAQNYMPGYINPYSGSNPGVQMGYYGQPYTGR